MLKMSEAGSLALHTMAYLAGKPGELVSAKTMARQLRASEAHLAKVMQRLVRCGLLFSNRGPRGGFRLARQQSRISLLEIFQAVDQPRLQGSCLYDKPICSGRSCIFGDLLREVRRQVKDRFQATTLHQVTASLQPKGSKHAPKKHR